MPKRLTAREPQPISVDVPPEVVKLLGPGPSQAAACLKRLALIELFRRGEVSSGYAAEVLGISRWDFILLLGDHGVPYVDMTAEELEADVEQARAAFQRQV